MITERKYKKCKYSFEALLDLGRQYDAEQDPQKKEKLKKEVLSGCDQVTAKISALLSSKANRKLLESEEYGS